MNIKLILAVLSLMREAFRYLSSRSETKVERTEAVCQIKTALKTARQSGSTKELEDVLKKYR